MKFVINPYNSGSKKPTNESLKSKQQVEKNFIEKEFNEDFKASYSFSYSYNDISFTVKYNTKEDEWTGEPSDLVSVLNSSCTMPFYLNDAEKLINDYYHKKLVEKLTEKSKKHCSACDNSNNSNDSHDDTNDNSTNDTLDEFTDCNSNCEYCTDYLECIGEDKENYIRNSDLDDEDNNEDEDTFTAEYFRKVKADSEEISADEISEVWESDKFEELIEATKEILHFIAHKGMDNFTLGYHDNQVYLFDAYDEEYDSKTCKINLNVFEPLVEHVDGEGLSREEEVLLEAYLQFLELKGFEAEELLGEIFVSFEEP